MRASPFCGACEIYSSFYLATFTILLVAIENLRSQDMNRFSLNLFSALLARAEVMLPVCFPEILKFSCLPSWFTVSRAEVVDTEATANWGHIIGKVLHRKVLDFNVGDSLQ